MMLKSHTSLTQTVLVIDDDEVMRDVLYLTLGTEGHSVTAVASGEKALRLLTSLGAQDAPSTVLADLRMPGLRGRELAERLRAACSPATVLLAMSGSQPKEPEVASYDGFLLKPFTPEDFAAACGKKTAPTKNVEPEKHPSAPILNETIYTKLAATMAPTQLKALYVMCLEDALARLGRMRVSAHILDAKAFVHEAHSLKGGCGMLGATELYGLAADMETGALSCTPLLDDFALAVARLRRMLEARS